jgi:replicative DNA helicase
MIHELFYINQWINSGDPSFIGKNNVMPEWFCAETRGMLNFIQDYCRKYNSTPTHRTMKTNFSDYVEYAPEDIDPTPAIIEYVKSSYVDSQVTPILTKMVESSLNPLGFINSVQDAVFSMQEVLKKVSGGTETYSWVKSAIDRYNHYMETHGKESAVGYPTGLSGLDNIMGGLLPDDWLLITARMGEGKSLLGDYIGYSVWNHLVKEGIPSSVLCINTEMTATQVSYRLDTLKYHVSNTALRFGKVADVEAYGEYMERLSKFEQDYFIVTQNDFGRNFTPMDIRAMIIDKNPSLVIVDQLYDIYDGTGERDIRKRIVNVTNALRAINLEAGIPFIVMAQAGRESARVAKKDKSATPDLDHIQESDNPAQKATKVLSLHLNDDILTLSLKKNRDGAKGGNLYYKVNIDQGLWTETDEETLNF